MALKNQISQIIKDFILNFVATMLPLIVLMFFIYPKLSQTLSVSNYGVVISLYGYSQLILGILLANLGYSRLLSKDSLANIPLKNYNIIFYCASFANLVIYFLLVKIMNIQLEVNELILMLIYLFLMGYNRYLIIEYRINKTFNKTLYYSLFLAIGYIIGLFHYKFTDNWIFIFLDSAIVALIYNLLNTSIWKEKLILDKMKFSSVVKGVLVLSVASLLGSITTYIDKLVVLPILGASAIAIFSTASFIPKIIPTVTSSLGHVLISYFIREDELNRNFLLKIIGFLYILMIPFFIIIYFVSKLYLYYFFKNLINDCLLILPYVSMYFSFQVFNSLLYPVILCFCEKKYQIHLQITKVILFIVVTIPILIRFGLIGFTIGLVVCEFLISVYSSIIALKKSINRNEIRY